MVPSSDCDGERYGDDTDPSWVFCFFPVPSGAIRQTLLPDMYTIDPAALAAAPKLPTSAGRAADVLARWTPWRAACWAGCSDDCWRAAVVSPAWCGTVPLAGPAAAAAIARARARTAMPDPMRRSRPRRPVHTLLA